MKHDLSKGRYVVSTTSRGEFERLAKTYKYTTYEPRDYKPTWSISFFDGAPTGHSRKSFYADSVCMFSFIEASDLLEQTYTKLTPKVGDKFRVVKEFYRLNTGAELTIERLDENDYTLPCLSAEKGWVSHKYLTTEYLEPVEEERGYLIIDGGLRQTTEEFAAYSYTEAQGRRLGEGVVAGLLDAQKTLNKTKQTTMQKLTSALKRVLSADKQTLYKAGVIGQDLTLTGNGRVEYTSALFDNEGDHKKAVAQMVEDAQAYIDEEKN